jgi:hypothetical protein
VPYPAKIEKVFNHLRYNNFIIFQALSCIFITHFAIFIWVEAVYEIIIVLQNYVQNLGNLARGPYFFVYVLYL